MPTRSDITVINSAFTTSSSARTIKLDNGWLITSALDSTQRASASIGDVLRIYKSTDNGANWSQLCFIQLGLGGATVYDWTVSYKGNKIYLLMGCVISQRDVYSFTIDAPTVTNINILSSKQNVDLLLNNGFSKITCIKNDLGTDLHVAYGCVHPSYPNSQNIRYVKGTINADSSVSWGAVEQLTVLNTAGYDLTTPSITLTGNQPLITVDSTFYFTNTTSWSSGGKAIFVITNNTSLYSTYSGLVKSGWSVGIVYQVASAYAQSSPSAIFVPQSINGLANGRIECFWQGANATNANTSLYYSYSDDGGVTWSSATVLVQATNTPMYVTSPSATASKNGDITVVFSYLNVGIKVAKMTKSGGVWGALTVVKSLTNGLNPFPSTLYDPTMNVNSPLFIYRDDAKVGFYGTWTITTISVTPGAIGTKTSADKSNFLTYTITTDGSMSTITEKVNGVTIGTKSATSGQSLIAGLTQAQWDAIKFGKYKDATGGLNTLTIEMGTDLWTYTFDKRLATNEDIAQAVKATQDTQTTYLPSVKTNLASAITSKGGTATGSDSFDTLVGAVGGLSGVRMASGTATSAASVSTYTYTNGTTGNAVNLTVTGLSFKPTFIYVFKYTGGLTQVSLYSEIAGDAYPKSVKMSWDYNSAASSTANAYHIKGDVAPASVANGSFTIPVPSSNGVYTWIAFG